MTMQIFTLLGALAMFLYGMNMMSSGIQKAAGGKLRSLLGAMTSNPFKAVLTGFGVTALIQSSSATTVLVVSFVSAGLLSLRQAIGVIMGANIGTTVTAWIISLLGFKFDIATLSVPLFLLGFLLMQMKKDRNRNIGEFVIGFSLLFLGLSLIKASVPDLKANPEVLAFIQDWTGFGFWSVLIFVAFGTILTLVLQSSSATMAMTLIMLNQGWIPFEMGAAMVLGENIGTTITANVAAAMGNVNARRTALTHTIFNVFGVIWALALFNPFIGLDRLVTGFMGKFNPLVGLSMFHTLFNAINTLILIWFTPVLETIAVKLLPDKKSVKEERHEHIEYISAGPVATPELGASLALRETLHFAQISSNEVSLIEDAVNNLGDNSFEDCRQRLEKYEEIADNIEKEIASFLSRLSEDEVSVPTARMVKSLYRISSELESLGDSGECISRILSRIRTSLYATGQDNLSADRLKGISHMLILLRSSYDTMISNMQAVAAGEQWGLGQEYASMPDSVNGAVNGSGKVDLHRALADERSLNMLRDRLRDEEFARIERGNEVNYSLSTLYLDLVSEIERMGDYIINISQALAS